jgi:dihydrofolate reductase
MKVSVYIATSLDGFIARPNGRLDWLPGAESDLEPMEVDEAISNDWVEFWETVDCLIQGRKTFEQVVSFGRWPYDGTRVIVLSESMTAVPEALQGEVEIKSGDLQALVEQLAAEGHEHLYIDGGQTIQEFLRLGLVTDMTIATAPILIGKGIPLFGPLEDDIPLTRVKTKTLPWGMVQSTYAV